VAEALAEQEIQRNNNLNGDGSQGFGSGIARPVRPIRECTYSDFLKCQPLNFKGIEGVVFLTQWFERIEYVFHIRQLVMMPLTELALLCGRIFPKESDKVEKYVSGLPDMIHESVMAFRPKKMTGERKEYDVTLPLCNKCKFHHNGPCTAKCVNCKKISHLTRDCWNPTATSNQRIITCYECGNQGHYKSDCPELKNQNHENQVKGTEASGMVYALGGGETNQDPCNIKDETEA
nr:hypothetical protein [Tanacetum cinerariifolium]